MVEEKWETWEEYYETKRGEKSVGRKKEDKRRSGKVTQTKERRIEKRNKQK